MVHPGPAFSVADVYNGWRDAFRELGCDVHEAHLDADLNVFSSAEFVNEHTGERAKLFNLEAAWQMSMRSLYAECFRVWPDLVFNVYGMMISPNVLRSIKGRGIKVATLFTESPYEDVTQVERAEVPDMVLVNDPTNLDAFEAANPGRVFYQHHCYRPEVHRPGRVGAEFRSDFCFVGTGYESRVKFLEAVDWSGIDAALAGHWRYLSEDSPLRKFLAHDVGHCCDNTETVKLYRGTKVSANLYRQEVEDGADAAGWAMGPREVELAAAGTFYLTEPRGENRDVLPMVPTFSDPGEFGDLIRYFLAHPRERNAIARQARDAVADRTFVNSARLFLQRLERLPVSIPV